MTNENIDDLLIIGAGPAGLAAAEAQRAGILNLLVLEKGPSHSQMIRTFYKEGKRVDAPESHPSGDSSSWISRRKEWSPTNAASRTA